jgi:hypothetical protein
MKSLIFSSMLCAMVLAGCRDQKLKHGFIRDKKVNSFRQILDLKNGCLLVMLHRNQNKIDALASLGRTEEATRVSDVQTGKNMALIKAFGEYFNFCPVYFFWNSQANEFREKGIGAITFLNKDLQADSSIRPCTENFFFGEFGALQMDTGKYFDSYRVSTMDTGVWLKPNYYSTSTFMFQAFTIQSPRMIQLKKPFPYYVRIIETDEKVWKYQSVIYKMNMRLHGFLEEAKDKIPNRRFSPYFPDIIN